MYLVDTCKVHLVIERGEDGRTIVSRSIICYLNACDCRLRGASSGLRGIVQGAIRGHRDSPMPWSSVHATNTAMSCRKVEKHKYCTVGGRAYRRPQPRRVTQIHGSPVARRRATRAHLARGDDRQSTLQPYTAGKESRRNKYRGDPLR